jgi:hypothetical protein
MRRAADDYPKIRQRMKELRGEPTDDNNPEQPAEGARRYPLRRLLARTRTLELDRQLRRRLRR